MTENEALFDYCLRLGDNSLILGHRLSEWCGHGPILEEDIALINIALDLVGQSRTLLSYAAEVEGKGRDEDDLAYMRNENGFKNAILVEQPNGHYGDTTVRQFLFDAYNYHFLTALKNSKDETLSGFAEKSIKEVTYHLRHSREWMLRLGDGTEESHEKIQESLDDLWMYSGELFQMNEVDEVLVKAGIAPDLNAIKIKWLETVKEVVAEATLVLPPEDAWMVSGGIEGRHSEHLGFLLAEFQSIQRAHPGLKW